MESEYPELDTPNSPTKRVGGYVAKGFESYTHNIPMLSLDNAMELSAWHDFHKRLPRFFRDAFTRLAQDTVSEYLGRALDDKTRDSIKTKMRAIVEDILNQGLGWDKIRQRLKPLFPRQVTLLGEDLDVYINRLNIFDDATWKNLSKEFDTSGLIKDGRPGSGSDLQEWTIF